MPDYQAVLSSHEISKNIADLLEDIDPIQYNGSNRARMIRNINDHLQGRNDLPLENLLDWAERARGGEYAARVQALCQNVRDFQAQKARLEVPYTKSSAKEYKYKTMDLDPARPLKVIDQQIYDWAAKAGFPPGFFRESYFDRVTFYCLPDHADCNFSHFSDCTFAVCRISDARFDGTSLFSSEFHSCAIDHTTFFHATLADTHFYDCDMAWLSFQQARLAVAISLTAPWTALISWFQLWTAAAPGGARSGTSVVWTRPPLRKAGPPLKKRGPTAPLFFVRWASPRRKRNRPGVGGLTARRGDSHGTEQPGRRPALGASGPPCPLAGRAAGLRL